MNIVEAIKIVNEMRAKIEEKQTSSDSVNEEIWCERLTKTKRMFCGAQQSLSFNEKMKIAFALSERDSQLRKAKKK